MRLRQGSPERETVYASDPLAVLDAYLALGARRLHLVDLDGARDGRPANLRSVRAIVEAAGVPCEGSSLRKAHPPPRCGGFSFPPPIHIEVRP